MVNYRTEFKKIIINHDIDKFFIARLFEYTKNYRVPLKLLNNSKFDVLVCVLLSFPNNDIENGYLYYRIIQYILQKCNYETLNYTVYDDNKYYVPLFIAIYKGLFKVANLLMKKGAKIDYISFIQNNEKVNIFQYFKYLKSKETKNTPCPLTNNTIDYIIKHDYITDANINQSVYDILQIYNYNKFEKLFNRYIYDNQFIVHLLSIYKNRKALSNQEIDDLLLKEKGKLKFDERHYKETQTTNIITFLDFDCDSYDSIFNKVIDYNLLSKAIQSNDKSLIKKIVNLPSFDIKCLDREYIFEEAVSDVNKKSTDTLRFLFNILKSDILHYCIEDLNLENLLFSISSDYEPFNINDGTISLYMTVLLNHLIETTSTSFRVNKNVSKTLSVLLILAIKLNNIDIIKEIMEREPLKKYVNINDKDKQNKYPIVVAYETYVYRKEFFFSSVVIDTSTFEYLIDQGAKTTRKLENGDLLFFNALKSNHIDILKVILSKNKCLEEISYNDYLHSFVKEYNFLDNSPSRIISLYKDDMQRKFLIYSKHIFNIYLDNLKDVKSEHKIISKTYIGIDLLYTARKLFTPIIFSYLWNKKEIFKFLLKNTNANLMDGYRNNLLFYVIVKQDLETLTDLMKNKSSIYIIDTKLVSVAVAIGNKDILICVLKYFQNAKKYLLWLNEIQFEVIKSKLYSVWGKIEILKCLLNLGTNVNYISQRGETTDYTLLHAMAEYEDDTTPIVKFLLEKGADINASFDEDDSLLKRAIESDNENLSCYLINNYSSLSMPVTIENEEIPLQRAIINNLTLLFSCLLENGANVNQICVDENGNHKSLLLYGLESGNETFIKGLMEKDSCIEYESQSDYYLLIKSLEQESWGLVTYIRRKGKDIAEPERIKETINDDRIDILQILIKHLFLDVNRKDKKGNTPIFYAFSLEKYNIFKYLAEYGSNLSIKNNKGETLDFLNKRDNYDNDAYHYNLVNTIIHNNKNNRFNNNKNKNNPLKRKAVSVIYKLPLKRNKF
ncbi:hypothetical protein PIROE2DRAFT_20756 [Piromyces sp. E2]|nr:hypothetical protein PIROE2DRAFT_20756 [Piromyces sp. E2]|eukprot:OUM62753.1 hypothetical protein PIROE2DRAFT_20756 [Piromyces sp. E2]